MKWALCVCVCVCVCAGAEVPTPYATNLELASFPQVEDIIKQVQRVVGKA